MSVPRPDHANGPESAAKSAVWLVFLVLLAVLVPYANAVRNDFVGDDVAIVRDNPLIRELTGIPRLFVENYWAPHDRLNLYRPVTVASYALNRALTGAAPWGFHVGNLLLHALASVLLFALGQRLAGPTAGVVAGCLFAVHPVHVEAVTGIVGRADLLAASGAIGAVLLWSHGSVSRARAIAVAAVLLLGLLSKESAIGAVVALLALEMANWRRGRPPSPASWIGVAVATTAYLAARLWVLGADRVGQPPTLSRLDNPLVAASLGDRLATAMAVLGRYLGLTVWPQRLSADYSYAQIPVSSSWLEPWVVLGSVGFLAAASLLIGAMLTGRRAVAVAIGLFLGPWLIISNVPVLIGTIMAERLFYLPSAGLLLLVGLGCAILPTRAAAVLVVPLVVALGVRTAVRNLDWRDEPTLFAKNAVTSPRSVRARAYHATTLRTLDRPAEAVAEAKAALDIDPDFGWTWNILAKVYGRSNIDHALVALRRAIALEPRMAEAHYNLGATLVHIGRFAEAIPSLQQALELHPYYPDAQLSLAEAYLGLGQDQPAASVIEQILVDRPDMARAHLAAGHLYRLRNQPARATAAFRAALDRDPGSGPAALALARSHRDDGDLETALHAYGQAQMAKSPFPDSFVEGAAIQARLGREDEAWSVVQAARRRYQHYAPLENLAGTLAARRGEVDLARTTFQGVLARDPGNVYARNHLDQLQPAGPP